MTHDRSLVLLDTNIWLSAYLSARQNHAAVLDFLTVACERDIELLYPVHAAKDIFFLIASDIKRSYRAEHGGLPEGVGISAREIAWACLEQMGELATPVPCDLSDVWVAEKQRKLHADFEDDLVIAAAMRADADLLVTEDAKLREHACVATASIEGARKWLDTLV